MAAAMTGAATSGFGSALRTAAGTAFDGMLGSLAGRPSVRVYALAFVAAAATLMLATYVVRQKARRAGLFDLSDARKLHGTQIPRVGGVGIVLAVAITSITLFLLFGGSVFAGSGRGLLVVFAGGLAIHGVGLYDDLRQLHARWKFLAQILIAVLVFAAGVRMTTLSLPFIGVIELGAVAGLVFTVLWFVGITNAFNLIDGLDGLAFWRRAVRADDDVRGGDRERALWRRTGDADSGRGDARVSLLQLSSGHDLPG